MAVATSTNLRSAPTRTCASLGSFPVRATRDAQSVAMLTAILALSSAFTVPTTVTRRARHCTRPPPSPLA